eukprot:SAG31_NODE_4890_length_2882_cov_3.387352_1_plen_69_part_00
MMPALRAARLRLVSAKFSWRRCTGVDFRSDCRQISASRYGPTSRYLDGRMHGCCLHKLLSKFTAVDPR